MIEQQNTKIDKLTLLLLLFVVLLTALFFYLFHIEQGVSAYAKNHEKLAKLELLNKDFDNFAHSINTFSDYDAINSAEKNFDIILTELQKSDFSNFQENDLLHKKLAEIRNYFEAKRENISYFKSLNASLISGSHFLFDLQRTITENKNISSQEKSLVNETLFYLMRYIDSDYIDKAFLTKKLQSIRKIAQKSRSSFVENFYKQSLVMIESVAKLKEVAKEIQTSQLSYALKEINTVFDKSYKANLSMQKAIAILFFIITIVLLIILIISHIDARKKEQELYAFRYAVAHSDNSIVITDPKRHITFVNDVFEKATGYTKEEVLGKNPRVLQSGKQSALFYKELNEKLDRGEKWEGEFINKRKDGTLFYEKASIVPIFLNNRLVNYLAIKLDITEYVEQNMKLAQAASVFENTEEAIIVADKEGKVLSVNAAFEHIYGYSIDEIKGRNLSFLHSGYQDKNFYKTMWESIMENGVWRGKIINKTKSGEIIPVWSTIKSISDSSGDVVNFTAIQTDLRELESSQQKADYLAYHDPLTGLYNRINFEEYLAHALFVAKRKESMLAVLFIDLDRFKVINDTLGHDIGDAVLVTVAKRLQSVLRESDFISRWGGDEFVVIVEGIASASEVAVVATNIIDALKEPMQIQSHHLISTASIGIALYPENGEDLHTLIKHADSAMYLAKDMGKNNFRFYTTELSAEIDRRLKIDMALHDAISKREIYMNFQPQYSLESGKIVALEALVRWQNSELGFVPPDKFIPIAEESGTIVELGYFIFEESCKAFKKMQVDGLILQQVAINVSSIQFKEPHLLETFLSIVKRHGLLPQQIEIEITERFIMENSIANMNLLQNFRNYGFKISIDDFGTGYSSMAYLKQLPVSTLKIDKSFVDGINKESADNAIIEAIIALAKKLGYSIVAEGIETKEQEQFLKEAGCDIGQGYLFSKPLDYEKLVSKFTT